MIVLSQTTDKIQVVLSAAVATNQVECVASWRDITSTPTYTPGRSLANTNNTTDVNLVSGPAASTQRLIDYISLYNADTSPVTLTIKYDDNGTDRKLWSGVIQPGERVEFTSENGFEEKAASEPAIKDWIYYATTWTTAPVFNSSITGGDVYDYVLLGTTRYRFVPSTYTAADDAFYTTFSAGTLSGKIASRG